MAAAVATAITNFIQGTTGNLVRDVAPLVKQLYATAAIAHGNIAQLEAAYVQGLRGPEQVAMRCVASKRTAFTSETSHEEQIHQHQQLRKLVLENFSAFFGKLMFAAYGDVGWRRSGLRAPPIPSSFAAKAAAKRAQKLRAQRERAAAKVAARAAAAGRRRFRRDIKIVYVLECEDGCIYVGATFMTSDARLAYHKGKIGAAWTQAHRALGILEVETCRPGMPSGLLEDMYLKKCMCLEQYGIAKVRGGAYSAVVQDEVYLAKKFRVEFAHAREQCLKCLQTGHKIATCTFPFRAY